MRRILSGKNRVAPIDLSINRNREIQPVQPAPLRNESQDNSAMFQPQLPVHEDDCINIEQLAGNNEATDPTISANTLNMTLHDLFSLNHLDPNLNSNSGPVRILIGDSVNRSAGVQVNASDLVSHPLDLGEEVQMAGVEAAGAVGAQGVLGDQGRLKVVLKTAVITAGVIYILPSAFRKVRSFSSSGGGNGGNGNDSAFTVGDNSSNPGNEGGGGLLFSKKNVITVDDISLFAQYRIYILVGFLGATLITVYLRNPKFKEVVDKHTKNISTQVWKYTRKWLFPWLRPLWRLFKKIWGVIKPFFKYLQWILRLLKWIKNLYITTTLVYFLDTFLPILKGFSNKIFSLIGVTLKTSSTPDDGVYLLLRNILEQLLLSLSNLLFLLVKLIILIISSINSFLVSSFGRSFACDFFVKKNRPLPPT